MNEHADRICPLCFSEITDDDEVVFCSQCNTAHHKVCWEANQGCASDSCQKKKEADNGNTVKYIGKTCPFCKTKLTEEDEIVICSDCEMPHHKECWIENKGCTTFGCQGTIQGIIFEHDTSVSNAPKYSIRGTNEKTENKRPSFCNYCGAPLKPSALFCEKCGKPVKRTSAGGISISNERKGNGLSSKLGGLLNRFSPRAHDHPEIVFLIGTNAEYYTEAFSRIQNKDEYRVWNWPAFLITPFWMMYRKIYIPGFALLGIQIILTLISGVLSFVTGICIAVAGGLLGNYLYLYDIYTRLGKSQYYPSVLRDQYLQKWKDVDAVIPTIVLIGYIVFSALMISR